MRSSGLLAPLLLSLALAACTGRSASPPSSSSTVGNSSPEVANPGPPAEPATGNTTATPTPGSEATGPVCGDKTCAADEQCISYFGIAGPAGPKFQECGIPCQDGRCPEGKKCQTIADGPGPVCR